ncbi:hypothetical protein AB0H97_07475 [Streptomyces sp. NPDC050788]|uniref:hypothetical protein n=1 Tax=Streptomyces sp. NPDC050788 TaxID=3155041 RepID=UPI00343776F7
MRFLVVLLVLAGCFLIGRWLVGYPSVPSRWRYTFGPGPEQRAARQALSAARSQRASARRDADRRVRDARRRVAEIVQPLQLRVRELQSARQELLRPGRGAAVRRELWLGELELYEHALVFTKKEPAQGEGAGGTAVDEELPLGGLTATFDSTRSHAFIRITRQDHSRRSAVFALGRYDEVAVDALAEAIHNQAVKDTEFRSDRQVRADAVAAEVKRVEAERAEAEERGRTEVAAATKRADAERERADALLRTAKETWQSQGGGLRPWR